MERQVRYLTKRDHYPVMRTFWKEDAAEKFVRELKAHGAWRWIEVHRPTSDGAGWTLASREVSDAS